jgi:16S rRNA (cytidine1402-2'-O)-methyltransferase
LSELATHYLVAGAPKGEVVVVIGPPLKEGFLTERALDSLVLERLKSKSVRDAAAELALETDLPKRHIYARALALSKN